MGITLNPSKPPSKVFDGMLRLILPSTPLSFLPAIAVLRLVRILKGAERVLCVSF
jgi:hypothetical protein